MARKIETVYAVLDVDEPGGPIGPRCVGDHEGPVSAVFVSEADAKALMEKAEASRGVFFQVWEIALIWPETEGE